MDRYWTKEFKWVHIKECYTGSGSVYLNNKRIEKHSVKKGVATTCSTLILSTQMRRGGRVLVLLRRKEMWVELFVDWNTKKGFRDKSSSCVLTIFLQKNRFWLKVHF